MIEIDWGDLNPPQEVRTAAEARVGTLPLARERVIVRRCGAGYEAHVRTTLPGGSTVLRLHGEDLCDVIDRAAELLSIVVHESTRRNGEAIAAAS
ncbi:MAG TPA: hypothetical protein VIL20_03420 [Sandaracinaceae bacterium]